MRIAMFTNTYLPHVGGVARSVKTLEDECRKRGHEVCVIAPESDMAEESPDVLRVPAIQNFNGSDFSVRLPSLNLISDFLEEFQESDWDRFGSHSEYEGPFTVIGWLEYYADHAHDHADQIRRSRAAFAQTLT